MYLFILKFIQFYVQFSVLCLIKDIFLGDINLIKYDLQTTVNNYKRTFNLNYNNLINLIPYFVILDIDESHKVILRDISTYFNTDATNLEEITGKILYDLNQIDIQLIKAPNL